MLSITRDKKHSTIVSTSLMGKKFTWKQFCFAPQFSKMNVLAIIYILSHFNSMIQCDLHKRILYHTNVTIDDNGLENISHKQLADLIYLTVIYDQLPDSYIILYFENDTEIVEILTLKMDNIFMKYELMFSKISNLSAQLESIFTTINKRKKLHFLIFGNCHFHQALLEILPSVDEKLNQQGYFTFLHQWILVTPLAGLFALESSLQNVQHVTCIVAISSTKANIYSAMWKPEGRKFEQIGYTTTVEQRSIKLFSNIPSIFPNVQNGFNGQKLVVATQYWIPFIESHQVNTKRTIIKGTYIKLLEVMSKTLNFTYTLKIAPGGYWAGIVNGSWKGIAALLQHKQADISVAPMTNTVLRSTVMDFADFAVTHDTYVAIYKKPLQLENNLLLFVKPFENLVWYALLLSTFIYSGLVLMCNLVVGCGLLHQSDSPYTVKRFIKQYLWVWLKISMSSLSQPLNIKSKSKSISILWITWWIFSLILIVVWTGNIISFLAIKLYPNAINDVQDIASEHNYKIGTLRSTFPDEAIQSSNNSFLSSIREKILREYKTNEWVLSENHSIHVEKVLSGGYIYFLDKTSLKILLTATNCSLQLIPGTIMPTTYSLAMQKNSAFKTLINDFSLQTATYGLYQYIHSTYDGHVNDQKCEDKKTVFRLTVTHFKSIFISLSIILSMSFVVLVFEIVYFKCSNIRV